MSKNIIGAQNPTPADIESFYNLVRHQLSNVDAITAWIAFTGFHIPHADFKTQHFIEFDLVVEAGAIYVRQAKRSYVVYTNGKNHMTNAENWNYATTGSQNLMPLEDFIPYWQSKLANEDLISILLNVPSGLQLIKTEPALT